MHNPISPEQKQEFWIELQTLFRVSEELRILSTLYVRVGQERLGVLTVRSRAAARRASASARSSGRSMVSNM